MEITHFWHWSSLPVSPSPFSMRAACANILPSNNPPSPARLQCAPSMYCWLLFTVTLETLLGPAPLPGHGEPLPAPVTVTLLSKSLCTLSRHLTLSPVQSQAEFTLLSTSTSALCHISSVLISSKFQLLSYVSSTKNSFFCFSSLKSLQETDCSHHCFATWRLPSLVPAGKPGRLGGGHLTPTESEMYFKTICICFRPVHSLQRKQFGVKANLEQELCPLVDAKISELHWCPQHTILKLFSEEEVQYPAILPAQISINTRAGTCVSGLPALSLSEASKIVPIWIAHRSGPFLCQDATTALHSLFNSLLKQSHFLQILLFYETGWWVVPFLLTKAKIGTPNKEVAQQPPSALPSGRCYSQTNITMFRSMSHPRLSVPRNSCTVSSHCSDCQLQKMSFHTQLLHSFVSSAVGSRTSSVPSVLQAQVSIPGVHREVISTGLPEILVQRSVKCNIAFVQKGRCFMEV